MIESFRLPLRFDVSGLQAELAAASAAWMPHFNTGYYSGNWSGIALRAPGGNAGSLYPVSHQASTDTPLLAEFPSAATILEAFDCTILSARFLRLERGAVIREHKDNALSFEDGEVRFHIPVITGPQVEFTSNGKPLEMSEGQCWYINARLPHSAANRGETDRIHLVIDCIVNDWVKSFFPKVEMHIEDGMSSIRSEKDFANMIEALQSLGTPVALEMAEKLLRGKGEGGSLKSEV